MEIKRQTDVEKEEKETDYKIGSCDFRRRQVWVVSTDELILVAVPVKGGLEVELSFSQRISLFIH